MKKIVTLSAAVLGACIVAPFAGKASLPAEKTNDPALKSVPIVRSTVRNNDRVVYVVTRSVETGSLLPTVYRIYQGRVTTATSRPVTSFSDLAPTGAEDVATALVRLDPSITVGAPHR